MNTILHNIWLSQRKVEVGESHTNPRKELTPASSCRPPFSPRRKRGLSLCDCLISLLIEVQLIYNVVIDSGVSTRFIFFFLFCPFRAMPTAYGSSQARDRIGTATATPDLGRVCDLHHSSWQCRILNPLSEARDRTLVLMDASWACYTMGTPGIQS